MKRKPRPHDFCGECGSDLGELPPEPPRCKKCRHPVKGHKGPHGMARCTFVPTKPDTFMATTIKAYGAQLDKMLFETSPIWSSARNKEKA